MERAVEAAKEAVRTVDVPEFSHPTPNDMALVDHIFAQHFLVAGVATAASSLALAYGPAIAASLGTSLSVSMNNARMGFA